MLFSHLIIITYILFFVNTYMTKFIKRYEKYNKIKRAASSDAALCVILRFTAADYSGCCLAGWAECSAADRGCTADLAD